MTRHANQATKSLPVVPAKAPVAEAVLSSKVEQQQAALKALFSAYVPAFKNIMREAETIIRQHDAIIADACHVAVEAVAPNQCDTLTLTSMVLRECEDFSKCLREAQSHLYGMEHMADLVIRLAAKMEACHD